MDGEEYEQDYDYDYEEEEEEEEEPLIELSDAPAQAPIGVAIHPGARVRFATP